MQLLRLPFGNCTRNGFKRTEIVLNAIHTNMSWPVWLSTMIPRRIRTEAREISFVRALLFLFEKEKGRGCGVILHETEREGPFLR